MISRSVAKQFLRVTVDAAPADVELLAELESKGDFGSKRDIFLTALRLLSGLFRAKRRGLRPQLIDPNTGAVTDFDWRSLPQIEPVETPRRLFASRVSESVVRTLRACAAELNEPDLSRVSAIIAQAVWDPSGEGYIDSIVLAELIVLALGRRDLALLNVTRDLVTQLCTAFESFDKLLAQAVHGYRPGLETRFLEQRFLLDEYRRELPQKYPDAYAGLRAKGAL